MAATSFARLMDNNLRIGIGQVSKQLIRDDPTDFREPSPSDSLTISPSRVHELLGGLRKSMESSKNKKKSTKNRYKEDASDGKAKVTSTDKLLDSQSKKSKVFFEKQKTGNLC